MEANLMGADLTGADLTEANLKGTDLKGADLKGADLRDVSNLDQARNLGLVRTLQGAKIERKWVKRLGLDAEKLGLEVVDDDLDPK